MGGASHLQRMTRRRFLGILAGTTANGAAVACLSSAQRAMAAAATQAPVAQGPAKYTLRLAHHVALTHFVHTVSLKFADELNKKTRGAVEVKVFGASQLGGLRDNTEGTRLGTLDFTWADMGTVGLFWETANIISLPFLFRDHDHWRKVAYGPIGQKLAQDALANTGIRTLAYEPSGFRVILSRNKPIKSAADMKGLKIRIPEVPIYVDTMKALGANATPIPIGELYTSLQTGVVDACELPPDTSVSFKLYEVTKYVSRTYHIFTDVNLVMSDRTYKGLPSDVQRAVDATVKEVITDWALPQAIQLDKDSYDQLVKFGLQGIEPDVESFRAAVKPVWEKFIAKTNTGDLVKAITDTK